MLFYIILFAICVFIGYFSSFLYANDYQNKRVLAFIDFLPFLILIIVTGFRFNVGSDYIGYAKNFEILKTGEIERIELSFRMIVAAAHYLGINQQFVFLTYAIISYVAIYAGVKYFDPEAKYRHFIIALLITFFLFNFFNTMRQMAAVAILFYGLKFIIDKKYIKYLLLVLIAYFFHRSAVIFGIFFLFILQFNIRYYVAFLAIAPIMYFTNFINLMIGLYVRLTGSEFYLIYALGGNTRVNVSSGLGIAVFYLLAVIFFVFYDDIVTNEKEATSLKLFIVYAALYLVFLPSEIATRMLFYPMVAVPIALPLLINITSKDNEKAYIKFIVSLLIILLLGNFLYNSADAFGTQGVLQYDFLWIGFD